jgi:PadR family transcriptional regulator PadR
MATDIGAQLRKGVVEYCILGLLQREPAYGWKLSEELIGRGLIASIGTLYPVLGRLRAQGLVVLSEQVAESDRPRKYYALTPAGTRQLEEFRGQWQPFASTVSDLVGRGIHQ